MEYIRGEERSQAILLPDSVDDYVDENNSVRVIDAYIDSLDLKELGFANSEIKETGRPPYNPKDLLKLYVYGYMNRSRSSRRLETESKRNLEVIWLIRKLSPDHKTIARFRQDNVKVLKKVFLSFVKLCENLDLYGKEMLALDGSKFKAVNSRNRNFTKEQIQKRIDEMTNKIDEYLKELENNDANEDTAAGEKTSEEIVGIISRLRGCKKRYEGYVNELEQNGENQKSLTDSDSRLMHTNGKMDVCYNVQTAVDAKNKLIVDFEVSNQANDKNFITPMANGAKDILSIEKAAVVTDGGYESIQDIKNAVTQGFDLHVAGTDFDMCIPAAEEEAAEITSHHAGRCCYVKERNVALCPMGHVLYPVSYSKTNKSGIFFNKDACKQCTCKCTKSVNFHYPAPIPKELFTKEYDDKGLFVKQIRIKADPEKIKERKSIVEHPFGTIKRGMDAGYCLTKGLQKVKGEFSLTFLAYNIKRVINILGCRRLMESIITY